MEKNEVEKLADDIADLKDNPCGMDVETIDVIVRAARSFLAFVVTPVMSRDSAASFLGVSVRTLDRLVEQGKIAKPKRRGFQKISFSRADLEKYKESVH